MAVVIVKVVSYNGFAKRDTNSANRPDRPDKECGTRFRGAAHIVYDGQAKLIRAQPKLSSCDFSTVATHEIRLAMNGKCNRGPRHKLGVAHHNNQGGVGKGAA